LNKYFAVDAAGPDGFVGKSEKQDLHTSSTGPWISFAKDMLDLSTVSHSSGY